MCITDYTSRHGVCQYRRTQEPPRDLAVTRGSKTRKLFVVSGVLIAASAGLALDHGQDGVAAAPHHHVLLLRRTVDHMVFRWAPLEEKISHVVPSADANALLDLLLTLPDGIHTMSPYVKNLTESSQNLGLLTVANGEIRLAAMSRSCAAYRAKELLSIDRTIASAFGFAFEQGEHSPAWAVNPKSRLTPITCQVYKELTGNDMVVEPVHGALECGAFFEKNPHIDMIAIGPSLFDVHTPKERCDLHSVQVTMELMIGVLKKISE